MTNIAVKFDDIPKQTKKEREEERYLDQIERLWKFFKNFKSNDEREHMICFLDLIVELRENKVSEEKIENILDNKILLEYVKTDNITYLIDFTKMFHLVESRETKDKIMDVIEGMVGEAVKKI